MAISHRQSTVTHTYGRMQVLKRNMYAYADVGVVKVPKDVPDEKLLFISDAIPTGYMLLSSAIFNQGILCLGLRCCWTICNDQRL